MVRVSRIQSDSIAAQVGLVPGTELLSVNGRALDDFLDWEFLTADEELLIAARLPDGLDRARPAQRGAGGPAA